MTINNINDLVEKLGNESSELSGDEKKEILAFIKDNVNKDNVNVNVSDFNQTLLHLAARNGNVEAIEALIAAGADLNVKNNDDKSPLYYILDSNKFNEQYKHEIQKTANNQAINNIKRLIDLLKKPSSELSDDKKQEILAFIKDKVNQDNVNVNVSDFNQTLLHLAAKNGNVEAIKALIEKGATVDAKDLDEKTPLHRAAQHGNVEAIKALIEKGAKVNAKDLDEKTPLHRAAKNGNVEAIKALIEKGATVDAKDLDEKTPLHRAAQHVNVEAIKALIAAGADLNVKNNDDKSPLHYILTSNEFDGLYKHEIQKTANNQAINNIKRLIDLLKTPSSELRDGEKQEILAFIKDKVNKDNINVNVSDFNQTLLHLAARNGHVDAIKALIKAGATVDATRNGSNETPLHYAVENGHIDAIKALIKYRADLNVKNMFGRTPLHLAVIWGKKDAIKALIKAGATVDAKDGFGGKTPLHRAAEDGDIDAIKALIAAGADLNVKNNDDKSPLHYILDINAFDKSDKYKIQKLANYQAKFEKSEQKEEGPEIKTRPIKELLFDYLKDKKQDKTKDFGLLHKFQYHIWHFVKNNLIPNFVKRISNFIFGENNFMGKVKTKEHDEQKKVFSTGVKDGKITLESAGNDEYFAKKLASISFTGPSIGGR